MSERIRTLIWLKPQFLGDAVMAAPAIDSLIASGRKVVIRAEPQVLSIYADRGDDVEPLPAEKIAKKLEAWAAAKRIRAMGFDEAFLLDRSFRSAQILSLTGIRKRIGHSTEFRQVLLTHSIPYDPLRNESECFLDLLRLLDIPTGPPRPTLRVSAEEQERENRIGSKPTIGFQPGARYKAKQYPIFSLAFVARAVKEMGFEVAAFGGPDEREAATEFLNQVGSGINLTGELPIRSSMANISLLRGMVGSDTGLMHIAAALGVPTVTLFGPNPPSKWGHDYSPHQILEAEYGETGSITIDEIVEALQRGMESVTVPTT